MSLEEKKPAGPSITNDPRWKQIVGRDKLADGAFWYSVATTGVYCRPSCASRPANPKNVAIYDTVEDARRAGFRACKRCNPNGLSAEALQAELVVKACRLIESSEEAPSLQDLADALQLSAGYLHRIFKARTGLTPKGYAAGCRADRVREALAGGAAVTEAIYDAGFNSSGRFYEQSQAMLGMTPSRFRAGGRGEELRFALGESSLGAILVASSAAGIAAILLGDDPQALARDLQDRFPAANLIGADSDYEATAPRSWAQWRRLVSASTFLSTYVARRSSNASGRHYKPSPPARRCPMPRWRSASALQARRAPWRARARPTDMLSLYRATVWSVAMEACPATPGAWSASR